MADNTMHTRALKRAAELLGGIEALRAYLGVPMGRLRWWMQGHAKLPDRVFLKIADVLAEKEGGAPRGRPPSP